MPYPESALLPISALQHLLYCERQCALIHVERLWAENRWTAEGGVLHKVAHGGKATKRPAGKSLRAVPLRSFALGLFGASDVVRRRPGEPPVPVEYKRGRPKKNDCDRVQLCAQALCLEEMTGQAVPRGELFYNETRKSVVIELTPELRALTTASSDRLHRMVRDRITPPAEPGRKCRRCSLLELCRPDLARLGSARSAFDRTLDSLIPPRSTDP